MGGAGYTGGELLRLLINHPLTEIVFVHSRSNTGLPVYEVHTDLLGETELLFTDTLQNNIDVIFLCVGHGEAKKIISGIADGVKVIDLSSDFRSGKGNEHSFVYGLPELNRERIKNASNIANPGCFATAIQLALLPLGKNNLLTSEITVSCTTGSTGAGHSLTESSHFSWRQNNLSVYKPFTHQHLTEINQSLGELQNGFSQPINMFPQRGAFTRGILACLSLSINEDQAALIQLYEKYYNDHPFVNVSARNIDLKQVINTNKCYLYLEKHNQSLMIISIIDNLLKGASGQAVQNMNLLFGLEETTGLKLKATAF